MGSAKAMTCHRQWTTSPLRYVLGGNPGILTLGWDAGRARILSEPRCESRAAPRRWVGGWHGLSAKLSQGNGLGAEAPSQNPPDPHRGAQGNRRNRLTTRPDREARPNWTLLSRSKPVAKSNGHGVGNGCVSGPAGALSPAQPPCSTERGRRSPHECWVRLVLWPMRPGAAPAWDIPAGLSSDCPPPPPLSPRGRGQKTSSFQGRGSFVS
jgi:hypothetical protein